MYIFLFRIFEQLALALKNRVALEFFTVLKNVHDSGFLRNLRLPWKQSLPWKFSSPGGRPPPRPPASYAYVFNCSVRICSETKAVVL